MKNTLAALALTGLVAWSTPASALTVGGYTFADNAFADTLLSSSGTFTTSGGALASVLTDIDAGTYAGSFSTGAFVELGFSDNTLVNGAGIDLVLFELGVPSVFGLSVTIGGTSRLYASSYTGFSADGFNLNAAAIDLDDFGLAPGVSLSSIVVRMDDSSNVQPSLSLVGALNSGGQAVIPEPGSLALAGLALAGLAAARRRLK